ncbi:hypothetical protein HYW55_06145 [Candidatus Gottesmanbacteria bacterium]|nr:hypothetical protein [Candidatus Gottesmanbacteria bacterium]
MRNSRVGKIIALILIIVGAVLIEPNLHFNQTQPAKIIVDLIENSFLGLSLIFIGGIHLLNNFFLSLQSNFGKKKCFTCQKKTEDILIREGDKHTPYCRNHLLHEFSKSFLQFPHKMVVFHPEQDRKYCGTMYPYYPISEFEAFYFRKEDRQIMEERLREIQGKCSKCKNSASVSYYRKGVLQWDSSGPVMRSVNIPGEFLCTKCTLDRIEPDLRANKNPFADNGLFVPYKGEGVFVNTYL